MRERLQKILSRAGVSSRREAEKLILDGRVQVNGKAAFQLGMKADPEKDHIRVDGKLLRLSRPVFLMLYKPKGYICSMHDSAGRRTVYDLLRGVKERVFSVGRLDYNSEGLLLFTNDGALANKLMHPSGKVKKNYLVKIRGLLSEEDLLKIRKGIVLQEGKTLPVKIRMVKNDDHSWVEMVMSEGKKNQIRRIFRQLNHRVLKLKRTGYAFLTLEGLNPGSFRFLSSEEIDRLRRFAHRNDPHT
ncbi:MAG: pseudouridine synthase [Acidobacteriota bacterium]